MSTDIASLGIAVDVTQVRKAVGDLDALGAANVRMARATKEAIGGLDQLGTSNEALGRKTRDINSAFKQFNDGLFAHERAAKAAADAERRLLLEQQALGTVAMPLTAGQIQFIEALKDQAAQAGKTGAELMRLKAAQLGMADEAAPFIDKIEKAGVGVRKFSIHTAEARESVTSLVRSAASGDMTQFGSSLTTLAGRSGVLRMVMSGTGLAVVGLLGAIGAGVAVMWQMESAQAELANALAVTGNAAGLTAASFDDMVETLGKDGNLADARSALLGLVATGRMSSEAMASVGQAALSMARATGQSADEVAREYAKMADGVVKFVDDHEKSQNLLTTSQYQHIRQLEEEGRAQEAMTAYGKFVDDALDKNTHKLGLLHGALRDARDGWDNFWKKAMSFDPASTGFKIATIIDEINMMNAGFTGGRSKEEIQQWGKEKTDELLRLYKVQQDAEDKAAEDAANATARREGKEAVRQIDAIHRRYESKKVAEARAVKEYKDHIEKMMMGGADNVPGEDKQAEIIAAIRKEYAETDNAARAMTATQINAAAALRELELKAAADSTQTRRALGQLDETTFNRNMSNLALEGIASRQLVEKQMLGIKGLTAAERAAHEAKLAQLAQEFVLEEQRASNREAVTDKKAFDSTVKAVVDSGTQDNTALDEAIRKQREYNEQLGMSGERVRLLAAERFAFDTRQLESDAQFLRNTIEQTKMDDASRAIYALRLSYLDAEIAKRNELAGFKQVADDKANDDERANRMTQQLQEAAQAARSFGEAMAQSFGHAGAAVGGLVRAMASYSTAQDRIARAQKQALGNTKDETKIAEINAKAAAQSATAQVNQYGDMAKAAKGFFKDGSKGYGALEAAEKAFRAVELAMAVQSHLTKSGMLAAFTGLFVTAKATEVAAETATLGPTLAVETTKQGIYGTTGLAAALSLPPPASYVAFAVTAAMLAAIGVAVSGSGGKPNMTSEDRQAGAGTGSVFGDMGVRQRDGSMKYKDKSDSIARSMELMSKNSSLALGYSDAMLRALRAIESSIGGLTNLAIRGGSLSKADGIQTGTIKGAPLMGALGTTALGAAAGFSLGSSISLIGSAMGPIGAVVGAAIGAVLSKAFKTKQEITDQGLKIDQQSYGDALGGVTGNTYADVNTKKSFLGMSYSNKDKTVNTGALDSEMSSQFAQVVASLGNGIKSALDVLDLGGSEFSERLKSFVINIGEISTKGLSGEEIEAQFQAVFSKLGDDMARFSIGGLEQFQKVGEGYFETMMRIASNYQAVDAVMASVGKVFGAVGTDSLIAREQFIELAGGLEELSSKTASFAQHFLTEEERLAPVRKYVTAEMARLGAASVTTRDQFKQLVLAQDTTTEAGREMYLSLLNLEQAFANTHAAAEDLVRSSQDIADERRGLQDEMDQLTMSRAQLRAKERAALAAENRVLFDMLMARQDIADAYERESQALTSTIERLKQFGSTLSSFLSGLDQGNLSALTPMEKMEEARRVYEDTLAKARAGDAQAQGQITQAAQNYLAADRVVNASSPTYTADFERVRADLRALMTTAGAQQTEAEQQLASMKSMTEGLVNLDDSTVSLTDAIDNLRTAIEQMPGGGPISSLYQNVLGREPDAAGLQYWSDAYAGGTSVDQIAGYMQNSPEKQVSDLYQNILGRAPDQQGLQYWTQKAAGGMSMDQIAAAFKSSSEYLDGSHATGLENVPFDGYKAELHAGEAVIDAPAMAALTRYFGAPAGTSQGGNTAALVAEIRALREEVAALRADQERQTGHIVHGNLTAAERSADKAAASNVEAARAQAWALAQREKMAVK